MFDYKSTLKPVNSPGEKKYIYIYIDDDDDNDGIAIPVTM
jgi:hypothetical protein